MSVAPRLKEPGPQECPAHVAIIMDGNGRWAQMRGLTRTLGHRMGVEAVRRTVKACIELNIPYLTLYGFSSENWKRPEGEVRDLMGLLRHYLRAEIAELHRAGVRLRVIGDLRRVDRDIVTLIRNAEEVTCENRALTLTIAFSYGGRQEIAAAARALAAAVLAGEVSVDEVDEDVVESMLETAGLPDPDVVIRTSGEQRLSNFLLWQSAYSELIFTDRLWPDFDKDDLVAAIREFNRRERRFGASVGAG